MLHILHLCNDFAGSKVHANLYSHLDKLAVRQTVFHPLRNIENVDKNSFEFQTANSKLVYSDILRSYHRILFRSKINFLYKSFVAKAIDIKSVNLQHATTMFSDGALAYKIYKTHSIPYVITLRNTDINEFLLYRKDLYILGLEILRNAQHVFFISPSLKEKFFDNAFFCKYRLELEAKSKLIYNGVDDFWLDNRKMPLPGNTSKFLYVGVFDNNKNVLQLIKALSAARENQEKIELHLVGSGGAQEKKITDKAKAENWITYHGPIKDQSKLLKLYRQSDFFVMASIFETFGLVYIEALSQGIPIGFTRGQGVDGVFEYEVGISFDANDSEDIKNKVLHLIKEKEKYQQNIGKIDFTAFQWTGIAKKYVEIYSSLT